MPPYIQKASGRGQARFANPTGTGHNVLAVIGAPYSNPSLVFSHPWDATVTYRKDAVVLFSSVVYTSLQESNLNNQPDINPSQWSTIPAYSGITTYAVNNLVTYLGDTWCSLQDSNVGHTPIGPPTDVWWTNLTGGTPFIGSNLFIGKNNFGANQLGDDQGNFYGPHSGLSGSPGLVPVQSDIWSIVSASLPGTHFPPNSGVQSVFMCPLASDQYLWIYELDSSAVQNAIDLDSGVDIVDAESGHDAAPSSFNGGVVGGNYNPPPTVGDFVVGIFGTETGSITAGPGAAWTEDTQLGQFYIYFQYALNGVIPVPTTTASGVVFWEMSLLGMVSAPLTPTTGNIVIQKLTSPSGSPQSFTFTPSYGAPFSLTDGQSNDSGALTPGTYSVAETPVTGWTTATSSDPANIVVLAGQTTTVTFTNTAPGTIIVNKVTVPSGSSQSFTFTPSYGAPFSLVDGQSNNSGPLVAATYLVAESPVAGWTTTTSQNPSAIVVAPGSTVTVTFTNTVIPGHIITTKIMVPPSTQRFTFDPSWGVAFTLGNGESNDSGPLAAGTYNISEIPVDGWMTTVSPNPANLTVVNNQTTTVTFTNTSSISGPPPNCDTPISTLAENVLNRLEEKFNVS